MERFLLEVMRTSLAAGHPGIWPVVDYWDQLGKPLMPDCSSQEINDVMLALVRETPRVQTYSKQHYWVSYRMRNRG